MPENILQTIKGLFSSTNSLIGIGIAVLALVFFGIIIWVFTIDRRMRGMAEVLENERRKIAELQRTAATRSNGPARGYSGLPGESAPQHGSSNPRAMQASQRRQGPSVAQQRAAAQSAANRAAHAQSTRPAGAGYYDDYDAGYDGYDEYSPRARELYESAARQARHSRATSQTMNFGRGYAPPRALGDPSVSQQQAAMYAQARARTDEAFRRAREHYELGTDFSQEQAMQDYSAQQEAAYQQYAAQQEAAAHQYEIEQMAAAQQAATQEALMQQQMAQQAAYAEQQQLLAAQQYAVQQQAAMQQQAVMQQFGMLQQAGLMPEQILLTMQQVMSMQQAGMTPDQAQAGLQQAGMQPEHATGVVQLVIGMQQAGVTFDQVQLAVQQAAMAQQQAVAQQPDGLPGATYGQQMPVGGETMVSRTVIEGEEAGLTPAQIVARRNGMEQPDDAAAQAAPTVSIAKKRYEEQRKAALEAHASRTQAAHAQSSQQQRERQRAAVEQVAAMQAAQAGRAAAAGGVPSHAGEAAAAQGGPETMRLQPYLKNGDPRPVRPSAAAKQPAHSAASPAAPDARAQGAQAQDRPASRVSGPQTVALQPQQPAAAHGAHQAPARGAESNPNDPRIPRSQHKEPMTGPTLDFQGRERPYPPQRPAQGTRPAAESRGAHGAGAPERAGNNAPLDEPIPVDVRAASSVGLYRRKGE